MATFAEHRKILKQIEAFKPQLEKLVEASGKLAVTHFTKSFKDGGFTDETFSPWKKRKRGVDTYKRGRRGESGIKSLGIDRGILIGKGGAGRLSRSIRSKRFGSLSAKIYTDVLYARIHNDGLNVNIPAHTRHKTIETLVRGSAGFVNGKWTRGRARKLKIQGESYSVKSYNVKMPKRQFIGYSGKLNRQIIAFLDKNIKKQFNK